MGIRYRNKEERLKYKKKLLEDKKNKLEEKIMTDKEEKSKEDIAYEDKVERLFNEQEEKIDDLKDKLTRAKMKLALIRLIVQKEQDNE